MELMQISDSKQDGVVVLQVSGMIHAPQAPELAERLMAHVDAGARHVVIDCTGLKFISSAGLQVFLHAAGKLRRAGGKLVLAALQDYVSSVFLMAGLAKIFEFFPTVAEAIAALK